MSDRATEGMQDTDFLNDDDLYFGFIQAICWASGAAPIRFNEPDELWSPSRGDNIKFSRADFLRHFADFDDGPVMMLKPIDGPLSQRGIGPSIWEVFCTEHPDAMDYQTAADKGFKFAAELAGKN